jgi:hypothetical protein
MKVSATTLAKINHMDASNFTYKVKNGTKCIVLSNALPEIKLKVSIHGENKMIELDHKARQALKQCSHSDQKKIEAKLEEIKAKALQKIKASDIFKPEVEYIEFKLDTKKEKGHVAIKAKGTLQGKKGFIKLYQRKDKEIKIESDLNKKDKLYSKLIHFARKELKRGFH